MRIRNAQAFGAKSWLPGRQAEANLYLYQSRNGPLESILCFRLFHANVKQRRLCGSMFAEFRHLIDTALGGLLLLPLAAAFRFIFLSLLSCVFFLPFGKS